jgi:quercetin dioxygenase-like cupin family protein
MSVGKPFCHLTDQFFLEYHCLGGTRRIGVFQKNGEVTSVGMGELISRKTMAYGDKTLLAEIRLEKGAHLPAHAHPHEQIGYLVSGRLVFTVSDEQWTAEPGDAWCFPGNQEHAARAVEDSVVIEVFSPVREEFLPE